MLDPAGTLAVVGAAAMLAAALLWPEQGLVWRLGRRLRADSRVVIEDALKHLHDCEARGMPCTLLSLAGALGLSGNRAATLLARLERLELVECGDGGAYRLAAAGRGEALRVVRIHRLWERYLSEETGLDPRHWHREAERREHRTTAAEAEALAARLGDPLWDPHGDPIPTSDGDVVPPRGIPLTALRPGTFAEIVHVEDEPQAIYAQLLAAGLHPGMHVRVTEASPRRIRLEADAREHVLEPVVAANLSVSPIPEEEALPGARERLSGLGPGERACVIGISQACRGLERRRLLDLGVVPGTIVEAELTAPGGGPTAYRVRGALIALRREQAELIHVDRAAAEARR